MAGASGGVPSSFAHAPQMFGDPSTHTITMPSQIREKKAALYEVIELQRSFVRIGLETKCPSFTSPSQPFT